MTDRFLAAILNRITMLLSWRAVAVTLSLTIAPLAAEAQPGDWAHVIAWMSPNPRTAGADHVMNVFRTGLRERGWIEGKDFTLVRALAARRATTTIPIVIAGITDPVNHGLVPSLARPGGNVTGVSMGEFRRSKFMQLLKEAVPSVRRVAILNDVGFLPLPPRVTEIPPALGLEVTEFKIENRQDLEKAFSVVAGGRFDAVYGTGGTVTYNNRRFIAEQALRLRLPAVVLHAPAAETDGLLFSHTTDTNWQWQRLAFYVDRILRGAKPADIPIEQSDKFELTINLKTAKALGITIPPLLLLRADRVIE